MNDEELPSDLRMDAYYYGFNETGVVEIDRILSSVAIAGKGSHSTEYWTDDNDPWRSWQRGKNYVEFIQNAAIDAAARLTALAEEVARLKAELEEVARIAKSSLPDTERDTPVRLIAALDARYNNEREMRQHNLDEIERLRRALVAERERYRDRR